MKVLNVNANGNNIPVTVFKNEKDGKVRYSIGISKKNADGSYENAYIMTQFKKTLNADDDLHNKDRIVLDNAILDFWLDENKNSNWKIFVFEYTKIGQENTQNDFVTIDDMSDLPF